MTTINEFGQPLGDLVENWQPVSMPAKVVLQGVYCILEPLDIEKHSEKLFENLLINNQGELWTYLPYGPFKQCKEFQAWIKTTAAMSGTLLYCVIDAKTQNPIGISGYLRITPEHGVIEVGHLHYSSLLKKTPIATEAMYLMMQYAFNTLGYRRYEWKCHSLNLASRNAALRLGFQFEGIFRQCNVFKNRNRDTAWFSIINTEWPALEQKFQRWLNPNNFDADGKQKISLKEI